MSIGRNYTDNKSDKELIGEIGFSSTVVVNKNNSKRVLITGAGSYIGESFKNYANKNYTNLKIDTIDMLNPDWRSVDFSQYDIVYHVAGIAHADVGKVSDETKEKYYRINTDLTVEVCKKAKSGGVKTFIFMSSMIVYGEAAGYGKKKLVENSTVPSPANFYGDSKLQADVAVRDLADDHFHVYVIRPPMIYGKGSKGNYPVLAKLSKKLPLFPDINNERSMLYIENLCEFLCQIMLVDSRDVSAVFFPQNKEWSKTADIVNSISNAVGRRIRVTRLLNWVVVIFSFFPGKIGGLVNKAFGSMTYNQDMSEYRGLSYRIVDFEESIKKTEK